MWALRALVDLNGVFVLFAIMTFTTWKNQTQTIALTFISGICMRECGEKWMKTDMAKDNKAVWININ